MSHYKKALILAFTLSTFLPHHALAIEEAFSEMATSTGKFAKKVGKSMGIGNTATEIERDVTLALNELLTNSAAASKLSKTAKAILIFPRILKAGFLIGGHHGKGALRKDGSTVAYYNTVAGSYGLQIGAQAFGYAMFFMDDKGLNYLLENNAGWEIGVGPSVVFVDEGMAKTMNNTTITKSVYVFTFNQQGLMAGLGIQGSKISKIDP